jgi:hypothetical protein
MSHPPIPEGSKIRTWDEGKVAELDLCGISLWSGSSYWHRHIIAAVAEVAWRRESERLDESLYAMERVGTGSASYRAEIKAQYDAAMEAAEQWRAWGEMK